MPTKDKFSEELKNSGILEAVIIDDAFDPPCRATVETNLQLFWTQFTDDRHGFLKLKEIFQDDLESMEAIEDDHIEKCWKLLTEGDSELLPILEPLFGDYPKRRSELRKLADLLESMLDIKPTCLRPDENIPDTVNLVFLDYLLGNNDERSAAIASLLSKRPNRPYLVLISDSGGLSEKSLNFRRKTGYLAGTFAHLEKSRAVDPNELPYSMASWGLGHSALKVIQPLFDAMIKSIDEASAAVKDTLRALTIQDYSLLQNLSLAGDGHPLGEYIVDLFGASLSYKFRDSLNLKAPRLDADSTTFNKHLPLASKPSHLISDVYREALTEPAISSTIEQHPWHSKKNLSVVDDGVEKLEEASSSETSLSTFDCTDVECASQSFSPIADSSSIKPPTAAIAWLTTGDIFVKDKFTPVLMVLNAGCDLQYAPGNGRSADIDQSIILIEGKLTPIADAQPFPIKIARTEFFQMDSELYRITWTDRVRSIPLGAFKTSMEDDGYDRRVARLTLPYALEVQQAWVANLGRVGVPVAPPYSDSKDVEIYVKNKDALDLKITVNCGATVARSKKSSTYLTQILISKDTVDAIRSVLKELIGDWTDQADRKKAQKAEVMKLCLENMSLWRGLQEQAREVKELVVLQSGILKLCFKDSVLAKEVNDIVVVLRVKSGSVSAKQSPLIIEPDSVQKEHKKEPQQPVLSNSPS